MLRVSKLVVLATLLAAVPWSAQGFNEDGNDDVVFTVNELDLDSPSDLISRSGSFDSDLSGSGSSSGSNASFSNSGSSAYDDNSSSSSGSLIGDGSIGYDDSMSGIGDDLVDGSLGGSLSSSSGSDGASSSGLVLPPTPTVKPTPTPTSSRSTNAPSPTVHCVNVGTGDDYNNPVMSTSDIYDDPDLLTLEGSQSSSSSSSGSAPQPSVCGMFETPVSVEGVEGVFCVSGDQQRICSGLQGNSFVCPGSQPGLPHGSYCAFVASGVFGCRPNVPCATLT
ncbi:hypothetical protein Poli38472_011088 [Pythium oligandrum]|uniref:Uncharacterized protein n=1 Tax=Pythium oligandrum TaxID=41045 RepID=A0A8K1FRD1_PYTOL|nr:hypothetical protein Poli38472_011088 [Pythium oligandrum]|eukprot:TMW67468.1 hypothetical protein Poli38472_011088 [Pythium oligandrum]